MKKVLSIILAVFLCFSLAACGGDKDNSSGNTQEVKNEKINLGVSYIGQEITYGSYIKAEGYGYEPLQWEVLDIVDGKALIISKYAIEPKGNYDEDSIDNYMSILTDRIFTESEKQLIVPQVINGEQARLFLLDSAEVEKYMPGEDNLLRFVQATGYATSEGVEIYTNVKLAGCCNWLLRDYVYVGGQLGNAGRICTGNRPHYGYGIRPAVWVNIL